MAQLTRKNIKLFAGNSASNQTGKVGTYKLGSAGVVFSKDPAVIQAGEWENGMANTLQSDYAPFLEEYNSIIYCMCYFLKQLSQTGIMHYDEIEEYYIGSVCVSTVDHQLYRSIQGTSASPNIGQEPSVNPSFWELYSPALIGEIKIYAGATIPSGYLLCDGAEISRLAFAELFAKIGTTYGTGNGSTTFNIPNLKNRFPQGADNNLGTVKSAGLPNITGTADIGRAGGGIGMAVTGTSGAIDTRYKNVGSDRFGQSPGYTDQGISFNASLSNSIYGNSSTVQPPATCVNYIIKY